MPASYDMEAAEPIAGRLPERVELTQVNAASAGLQLLSDAGLRSTGRVA